VSWKAIPDTRPRDSETSVTECVVCAWNNTRSVGRRAQVSSRPFRDQMYVVVYVCHDQAPVVHCRMLIIIETVAGVCRTCFTACCATCLKSTGSFTSTQTKSFILPPFFLVASLTRASLRKSCCALQGFTATSDHMLCYILPVPTLSYRFLLWMYSR